MTDQVQDQRFGPYAKQRLFRVLIDLVHTTPKLSWSGLADHITEWRKVKFQRQSFYRLRDGTLDDANIEIIIGYVEAQHDGAIRDRLHPDAIFDELAKPARDYYFHIPEANDIDEWNEQILDEFSGVYFCVPASDENCFMPTSYIRRWLQEETRHNKAGQLDMGKLNTFIQRRMILILQKTPYGYFYAAELPLSALASSSFQSSCQRVLYEGIGVISSNTIQVKLRDCLTRVAKTHSIVIGRKYQRSEQMPHGLSFHVYHNQKDVVSRWQTLSEGDVEDLKLEQHLSIASEFFLQGPVSEATTPLPNRRDHIMMTIANDYVYFRKPPDFLANLDLHFVLSELSDEFTIRKILENPLVIGTMYEH